jgi:hypothetical protein
MQEQPIVRTLSIDGRVTFIAEITDLQAAYLNVTVKEVNGWTDEDCQTPYETELYLKAMLKWDRCCHVHFGEEENPGYLHLCGLDSWKNHVALMEWIYRLGTELISRDDGEGWDD